MHDLFVDGYVDIGILQPTYLTDFYVNGFNTTEHDAALKEKHPDRFILNSAWDPRDEEAGLAALRGEGREVRHQGRQALHRPSGGATRAGWSLTDPVGARSTSRSASSWASRTSTSTRARRSGRSTRTRSTSRDVDDAATTFTDLNFIVEHFGMPRIEDFCWIARRRSPTSTAAWPC